MTKLSIFVTALLLCGCAIAPHSNKFQEKQIETGYFSIAVWEKSSIQKGKPLRIYYEGDGNPNPYHTVAFDLAEADKTPNVIYVARPCQWTNDKICEQKKQIYQEARFHPEIMAEMKELTDYLIRKHQAPSVELIGYDGGAVIALNMAPQFPTSRVITVAGITDVAAYNTQHDIEGGDPEDIDDPADKLNILANIPQVHYVGKDDDVTPRRLVERFVGRMQNPKSAVVKVVPNTNHTNWRGVKLDY
ncbi:MAG: hypothetical protein II938_03925 [Alphaproteobacteria bacterium]|nr:hypothetical protein [Alphaproteobacteria bacterium]